MRKYVLIFFLIPFVLNAQILELIGSGALEDNTGCTLPDAITVSSAVGDVFDVTLTWTDVDCDSVQIFRGTSTDPTTQITSVAHGVQTYLDSSGLAEGTIYYYRIKAKNSCGTSDYSTTVFDTTFSPSQVPGIQMWFTGSAGFTVDGDTVETWTDQVNDSVLTKTYEATQDYFVQSTVNGQGSVKWQTSTPEMKLGAGVNYNTWTFYILCKRGNISNNGYLIFATSGQHIRFHTNPQIVVTVGAQLIATTQAPNGATVLIESSSDGATITDYVASSAGDTTMTVTSATNADFERVGVTTAGQSGNEIIDIIPFNVDLAEAWKTKLRLYCKSKGGIP